MSNWLILANRISPRERVFLAIRPFRVSSPRFLPFRSSGGFTAWGDYRRWHRQTGLDQSRRWEAAAAAGSQDKDDIFILVHCVYGIFIRLPSIRLLLVVVVPQNTPHHHQSHASSAIVNSKRSWGKPAEERRWNIETTQFNEIVSNDCNLSSKSTRSVCSLAAVVS